MVATLSKEILKSAMSDAPSTRRTPAQKAVLAALQRHRQPLSAQVLHNAMRPQHSIGLATVYRSLDALQKSGLIQHRITLAGTTLYSLVQYDRHCMTCLHCGQSFPLNTCPVAALEAQLQHANRFKIYYHTLEFFGLCESCSVQSE